MQLVIGTWKSLVKGPKDTRPQWVSYLCEYLRCVLCVPSVAGPGDAGAHWLVDSRVPVSRENVTHLHSHRLTQHDSRCFSEGLSLCCVVAAGI